MNSLTNSFKNQYSLTSISQDIRFTLSNCLFCYLEICGLFDLYSTYKQVNLFPKIISNQFLKEKINIITNFTLQKKNTILHNIFFVDRNSITQYRIEVNSFCYRAPSWTKLTCQRFKSSIGFYFLCFFNKYYLFNKNLWKIIIIKTLKFYNINLIILCHIYLNNSD